MKWVTLWILIKAGYVISIPSSTEDSRNVTNFTESITAQRTPRSSNESTDDEFPTSDEDLSTIGYLDAELNADSVIYNETVNKENSTNSPSNNTEDNVEWRQLTNKYGFNPYANTRRIINNYALSKIMAESRPYYYRRILGRLDTVHPRNNFGKGSKKKSKQPESAVTNIREVREKLFDHLLNYVRGISAVDLIQNGTGSLDDKLTNYYDVAIGVNEKIRNQKDVSSKDKYSESSVENEHGETEENANDYELEGYDHADSINADTLSNKDDEEVSNKNRFDSTVKNSKVTLEDSHHFKVRNSKALKNFNENHDFNEMENISRRLENYENKTTALKPEGNKTMELINVGTNENISNDDTNTVETKQTQNRNTSSGKTEETSYEAKEGNKTMELINVGTNENISNDDTNTVETKQTQNRNTSSGKTEETSYEAKEDNDGDEITKIDRIWPSRTENNTKLHKKYHGRQTNESNEENDSQNYQNRHNIVTHHNTTPFFNLYKDTKQKEHLKTSEKDKHQTSDIKTPDRKDDNGNQIESIQTNSKQDKHKEPQETEIKKINKSKTINGTESNKMKDEKQRTDTEVDTNGRRSQAHNNGIKTYRHNTKDESGRIHLHFDFEIF